MLGVTVFWCDASEACSLGDEDLERAESWTRQHSGLLSKLLDESSDSTTDFTLLNQLSVDFLISELGITAEILQAWEKERSQSSLGAESLAEEFREMTWAASSYVNEMAKAHEQAKACYSAGPQDYKWISKLVKKFGRAKLKKFEEEILSFFYVQWKESRVSCYGASNFKVLSYEIGYRKLALQYFEPFLEFLKKQKVEPDDLAQGIIFVEGYVDILKNVSMCTLFVDSIDMRRARIAERLPAELRSYLSTRLTGPIDSVSLVSAFREQIGQ
ncbi:MAG: hypothetical protein EA369_08545 [Bradymonadales bacterium]|nr:MAG: hypothetical protein EA369_08545 [Bradymonadales bacterium]